MSLKTVLAVAVLSLGLTAVQAYAEGEGAGDPMPFHAAPQVTSGLPLVADTGSNAYPDWTGNTVQPSSLAQLEPVAGREAPVQTANALPASFNTGTVAYVQAESVNHAMAQAGQASRKLAAAGQAPGN